MKVLIFSVSIGAGHDSVAKAVAQEIKERSTESEILIVDTFQYINPILNKVVVGSYMETLRFTPKVWGYLYTQAEETEKFVDLGQIFSNLLSPKMEKLLQNFNPDVLVCSHAFPAGILSALKKKRKLNIPLVACITDFTVHSFWMQPYVDQYIIPHEDLIYPFLKEKIPLSKLKSLGIPIRKQFLNPPAKKDIRDKLGLQDQTTILVMGGGLGLGNIKEITIKLLKDSNLQILVVAGKNEKLHKELKELRGGERLHVYGFVEDVSNLMAAADLLISKPGGVTTAEALAMELPMIIYSPLPGQEDRNTHYLLNRGIAIQVRKIENLVHELNIILNNTLRFKQIKEMLRYFSKPKAVIKTVDILEELVEKKDNIK